MKTKNINKKLLLLLITFTLFQLGTAEVSDFTTFDPNMNFSDWDNPNVNLEQYTIASNPYGNSDDQAFAYSEEAISYQEMILTVTIPDNTICPRCGGDLTTSPCENPRIVNGIPVICGYVYGSGDGTTAELPEPIGSGLYILLIVGSLYICIIVYRRIRSAE